MIRLYEKFYFLQNPPLPYFNCGGDGRGRHLCNPFTSTPLWSYVNFNPSRTRINISKFSPYNFPETSELIRKRETVEIFSTKIIGQIFWWKCVTVHLRRFSRRGEGGIKREWNCDDECVIRPSSIYRLQFYTGKRSPFLFKCIVFFVFLPCLKNRFNLA